METSALYRQAELQGIPIFTLDIPENGSMCIQTDLRCYIGIDYSVLVDEASQRVHLAHELGHCETGAFYNRWTALDIRQKHENCADKWAIKKLVPKDELDKAVENGHTEIWDLAEHFNVTEDFMRKAVCWYKNGNLAMDVYL